MNEHLRKSLPARGAAIGFCVLIVFGNLWGAFAVMSAKAPSWVSYGFAVGMIVAGASGIALASLAVYWRLRPPPPIGLAEEPHE